MGYHEAMVKAEEALGTFSNRVRCAPRKRPAEASKPVLLKGETPPLHELLTRGTALRSFSPDTSALLYLVVDHPGEPLPGNGASSGPAGGLRPPFFRKPWPPKGPGTGPPEPRISEGGSVSGRAGPEPLPRGKQPGPDAAASLLAASILRGRARHWRRPGPFSQVSGVFLTLDRRQYRVAKVLVPTYPVPELEER
uniref:Bbc protein n=1 Tax=Thermus aquaticus TaxID=271 RepID=P96080_THEAQ|nr:bbc [Thermus aquaticus]